VRKTCNFGRCEESSAGFFLAREKKEFSRASYSRILLVVDLLPAVDPFPALPDASPNPDVNGLLARLLAQAEASFRAARAGSTLRAYAHDWRQFRTWCDENRLVPLPASPQTIILYSTDLTKNQSKKWNTLSRRLAAISQLHQQAGFASPTRTWAVQQFMAGLRRELGIAPARKKPVLVGDLQEILKQTPDSLLGKRDRALLLLGFSGAFRRSELVGLDVEDLAEVREGMVVNLRRSKTDQAGEGRKVGIPQGAEEATCPVRALQEWRAAAGLASGPLFRTMNRHGRVLAQRLSGEGVAIVVKRYVEKLGFDPARFAGHSLRAGLATSAAAAGKSERAIMNQTGHRSVSTVRRYICDGNLFRENAASGLGL
jgi:integrase